MLVSPSRAAIKSLALHYLLVLQVMFVMPPMRSAYW